MATKIFTVAMLFTISMATIFCTCKKGGLLGCPESSYSFEIDARVYPDKDSINIGDTIWAEINAADVFVDRYSNQQISFSNAANMGTNMGFQRLVSDSPTQVEGAVTKFKFLLVERTFVPNPHPAIEDTIIKNFIMKDINGKYLFRLAIIPQDTGTFRFNFGNFVGVYRNNQPCPKADFTTNIIHTNQHYYLFPGGTGIPPGGPDYAFYVKQ
ncbi:MAG TPA: hypothetical protein VET23_10320 [Chitinophagaceae bacterium]|nr:hypothetical protein [Chitinophagaceae bacterium]